MGASVLRSNLQSLPAEIMAIFDCALEGVMIADSNYVICYINPAYSRMTGLSGKQEIGRLLTPAQPFGPLRTAVSSGMPVYGRRYHPAGSKADLIVNASPIVVNGRIKGGVSFCQDISAILLLTAKLAESKQVVQSLTEKLASFASPRYTFDDIITRSQKLQETIRLGRKAAMSSSTVLILGESGTGKELFAHSIHNDSIRKNKPFLKVNCAAIPDNLLESEFFGYEKGAFTGANSRKMGLFERADGGTLFLDEIGDMSLPLQPKILRVLQDGEVTRVGSWQPVKVDVRFIAASNRNLPKMVEERKFREDLYFRLNVVSINIPPLRERPEDIPVLLRHILTRLNRKLAREIENVDSKALERLYAYTWPGNIRELENVLERAVNLAEGKEITCEVLLLPDLKGGRQDAAPVKAQPAGRVFPSLAEQESLMIQNALAHYGTTVEGKRQAAWALGISLATLYKRLKAM